MDLLHKATLKLENYFTKSQIIYSFVSYKNLSERGSMLFLKVWG